MPIKRPAKRIAPKTLENMKSKSVVKKKSLKELLDELQKPTLEQQKKIDDFHKKISSVTPELKKIIIKKK